MYFWVLKWSLIYYTLYLFVFNLKVTLYHAAFDEDGHPYNHEREVVVTLQDPSKIKVYTWYMAQQKQHNEYDVEDSHHSSHVPGKKKDNRNFRDSRNMSSTSGKFENPEIIFIFSIWVNIIRKYEQRDIPMALRVI